MQSKRTKRSRIRAAKPTSGHGHKKKNRGAGHRGGRGKSGSGKRGSHKIMKVTGGKPYLGKHGFNAYNKEVKAINLTEIQKSLSTLIEKGFVKQNKDVYEINLTELGYDKLLSKGDVTVKLSIKVNKATPNAVLRVQKAGGVVTLPKKDDE